MSRSLEKTVNGRTNGRTDGRTYERTNAIAMDPSGTRGSKNQKNLMKCSEDILEKPHFRAKFDLLTRFPQKRKFFSKKTKCHL